MSTLLDPNPPRRSAAEWRPLLAALVESLSTHVGVAFRETSSFIRDDQPGHASACNCIDIRGTISAAMGLDACGVVCVTVNFGEAAWAGCELLMFAAGRRLTGPAGTDVVSLGYDGKRWAGGWWADENGEWESHTDDARWQDERPAKSGGPAAG